MNQNNSATRFGRYELTAMLGQGGFATVYRAWDPALGREVALKALLPHLAADEQLRRRFLAEARALAGLHHAHIVTIYDVGEADGRPFFTMEMIAGHTLAQLCEAGGPAPLPQVIEIVRGLAGALDYLHEQRIVHRDIKAANVMVEKSGRVVLMDFGIARALDQTQFTRTGLVMGTLDYMAPEQARGTGVGPPADIYALGVLTYQLLAGRLPFTGDTARLLYAHINEPPPPLEQARPGLPAHVYAAVNAVLEKDPGQRPRSASAFAAALAGGPLERLAAAGGGNGSSVAGFGVGATSPPITPAATSIGGGGGGPSGALIAAVAGAGAVLGVLIVAVIILASGHRNTPAVDIPAATVQAAAASPGSITGATAAAAGTATSPAPAATPATPAPSLIVNNFDVRNADGWAQGQGDLTGCYSYRNGPAGGRVALLVTRQEPSNTAYRSEVTTLAAQSGDLCSSVPPAGAMRPGNYVVRLYDEHGNDLSTYAFTVQPQATPPATAAPVTTVRADRPPPFPPTPPDLFYPIPDVLTDPPMPRLKLTSVTPSGPAYAGQVFEFRVTGTNVPWPITDSTRSAGANGSISVSSPDAVNFDADTGTCDVPGARAKAYPPGTRMSGYATARGNFPSITSRAWLAEVEFPGAFPAGVPCTLIVRATIPAGASSVTFLLRIATFSSDGATITWPGGTGVTDQQGYAVIRWVVPVERPR